MVFIILSENNVPLTRNYSQKYYDNSFGYFEPDSVYFTVNNFFNQPSTQKVPGIGIYLYSDYISTTIKYVQYQVDHFWYSECFRSAFVLSKSKILNKFSDVFRTFDYLKKVSYDLNQLEIKKNDLTCFN